MWLSVQNKTKQNNNELNLSLCAHKSSAPMNAVYPSDSSSHLGSVLFPPSPVYHGSLLLPFPVVNVLFFVLNTYWMIYGEESPFMCRSPAQAEQKLQSDIQASLPPINPDIETGNKESLYVQETLDKGSQLLPRSRETES